MFNLYYIIPFVKCGVLISKKLCGKKLRFKYNGIYDGEILFPKVVSAEDGGLVLDNPLYLHDYAIGLFSEGWGTVGRKFYDCNKRIIEWKVILRAIAIRINYTSEITDGKRIEIKNELDGYVNNVLQYLLACHNYSLTTDFHHKFIDEFSSSSWLNPEKAAWEGLTLISVMLDQNINDILKTNVLRYCINNAYKDMNMQYKLMSSAYENFFKRDYRNAILCLATSVEMTQANYLIDQWKKSKISNKKIKRLLYGVNGFSALCDKANDFNFPLYKRNEIQNKVMNIRNKVIHKADIVTKEEVEKAFALTNDFLTHHNVSVF